MDNKPKIIASWEGKTAVFRAVSVNPRSRNPRIVVEKRYQDALGGTSWQHYIEVDINNTFYDMLEGLNTGKYELVKKW
jgi:hypothetical protein